MPRAVAPQKPNAGWRLWLRIIAWSAVAAGLAFGAREVDSFLLRDPRFGLENPEIRGAEYAGSNQAGVEMIVRGVEPGDMILTLGAGSVSQLGDKILEKLNA